LTAATTTGVSTGIFACIYAGVTQCLTAATATIAAGIAAAIKACLLSVPLAGIHCIDVSLFDCKSAGRFFGRIYWGQACSLDAFIVQFAFRSAIFQKPQIFCNLSISVIEKRCIT